MMYLNEDDEEGFSTLEEGLTVTYDVFKYGNWSINPINLLCLTVTYDVFKLLYYISIKSDLIRLTVTYDVFKYKFNSLSLIEKYTFNSNIWCI